MTGVQIADAIRTRVTNTTNIRTLYVIPKEQIDQYLTSSGYKADSALGPADLKELAKLLRGDEVMLGTVSKTGTGVRVEARLALARDVTIAQPLPAAVAASPQEAARAIERSLTEARKQLVDNKACESALRDQKYPAAIAAANAGILKYPSATLVRLCLASALQAMKASPDSVLRVVNEIKRIDPKNSFVHRLAYQAYTDKNEPENAVRALVDLLRLEPTNLTLQSQVIAELAKLGRPSVALPIVDTLLAQNPGDPQMIRQKWLLTLAAAASDTSPTSRAALFATAVQAGEALARADSAMADSTYFSRQLVAAAAAGNQQKAIEFASLATQKFPNNAMFWFDRAAAERKAGQLQMAQQSLARVLTINPKYPNAGLLQAQIFVEMNQPDSAVAAARRAVAAGEDSKQWGSFLLSPVNALFKEAQADQKNAMKWRRVLTLAKESDRLSPSSTAAFFVGVSAYYLASDALEQAQGPLQQAQKTENKRQKAALNTRACPYTKEAQEMMIDIQTYMPRGGATEPTTAQQILGWVGQASPAADQMTKAACK